MERKRTWTLAKAAAATALVGGAVVHETRPVLQKPDFKLGSLPAVQALYAFRRRGPQVKRALSSTTAAAIKPIRCRDRALHAVPLARFEVLSSRSALAVIQASRGEEDSAHSPDRQQAGQYHARHALCIGS